MKYYSVLRPIGIGTLPKSAEAVLKELVNFDERTFVSEINRMAWGYIETTEAIPIVDADLYDLVSNEVDYDALVKLMAKELVAAGWNAEAALEEAESMEIDDIINALA